MSALRVPGRDGGNGDVPASARLGAQSAFTQRLTGGSLVREPPSQPLTPAEGEAAAVGVREARRRCRYAGQRQPAAGVGVFGVQVLGDHRRRGRRQGDSSSVPSHRSQANYGCVNFRDLLMRLGHRVTTVGRSGHDVVIALTTPASLQVEGWLPYANMRRRGVRRCRFRGAWKPAMSPGCVRSATASRQCLARPRRRHQAPGHRTGAHGTRKHRERAGTAPARRHPPRPDHASRHNQVRLSSWWGSSPAPCSAVRIVTATVEG